MTISISELIAEVGDGNVRVQFLDEDLTNLQLAKGHNRFTFGSAQPFGHDGTVDCGVVVWMPRDAVKAAAAAIKARKS